LFARSHRGGERWAIIASLTDEENGVGFLFGGCCQTTLPHKNERQDLIRSFSFATGCGLTSPGSHAPCFMTAGGVNVEE
jgi:hypothetical protein